jgi:hypothetical protein
MTIVTSYDFESDTWTHHNGDTPARQAWREAVAEIAAKGQRDLTGVQRPRRQRGQDRPGGRCRAARRWQGQSGQPEQRHHAVLYGQSGFLPAASKRYISGFEFVFG